MIDYVSMQVIGIKSDHILRNPQLSFQSNTNAETGQQIPDKYGAFIAKTELDGMSIEVKTYTDSRATKITVKGSLHKYHMKNNYEDFHYHYLRQSVENLCHVLRISPGNLSIHGMEFGVNVIPPIGARKILEPLISHRGKDYELRTFGGAGFMKRFCYSHYELKVYDKGYQYGLPFDVLRVEVKAEKMEYLHGKGIMIETCLDLLDVAKLTQLHNLLIDSVKGMIFTDDRIHAPDIPTKKNRAFFIQASNPRYWTKLRKEGDRSKFKRKFDKLDVIRSQYAPDDIKADLLKLVSSKWQELNKSDTFLPLSGNDDVIRFYTHIVGQNVTQPRRYCLTCGRDITGQKPGSRYCSEKIHGREVKRCRNRVSNLKVHEIRHYPGATLFDIDSMLKPDDLRLKHIAFNHT